MMVNNRHAFAHLYSVVILNENTTTVSLAVFGRPFFLQSDIYGIIDITLKFHTTLSNESSVDLGSFSVSEWRRRLPNCSQFAGCWEIYVIRSYINKSHMSLGKASHASQSGNIRTTYI